MYDQLVEYLTEKKLLNSNHHGFRQNRSTSTTLLHLYDLWMRAAESGQLSAVLMLDLCAGFDMVSHSILIAKLTEYGLDHTAVNWFRSYLDNRVQCVQVESAF